MDPPALKVASLWHLRKASEEAAFHPGEHSFWASLAIVETHYRPIAADEVVVVVMDDRVLCRVVRSAFVVTIHLGDIVRLLCTVRRGRIEIHVPAVAAPTGAELGHSWTRMYMFEPFQPGVCEELYHLLLPRLPRSVRSASALSMEESTPWRSHAGQPLFLPPETLEATGFHEVPLDKGHGGNHPSSRDAGNTEEKRLVFARGDSLRSAAGAVKPVRVHLATAPPEWRMDLLRQRRHQCSLTFPPSPRQQPLVGSALTGHCGQCHQRLARVERLMDEALADDGHHLRSRPRAPTAAASGDSVTLFPLEFRPPSHA